VALTAGQVASVTTGGSTSLTVTVKPQLAATWLPVRRVAAREPAIAPRGD